MNKKHHEETKAVFDAESRKQFLLKNMHAKEIRRKEAIKRAEKALKEERRERKKQKKEKAEEFVADLTEKQKKLGITPLDILMNGKQNIQTVEYEVNLDDDDDNDKEEKESSEKNTNLNKKI